MILQKAVDILLKATVPQGIMALSEEVENYKRIWARDSMIAGLAALLSDNVSLTEGMRASCLSLQKNQHPTGSIPSNVSPDFSTVSYGSLAGRVDATSWWLIGSGLFYKKSKDHLFLEEITSSVKKAIAVFDYWEFNGRGLVYTPMSGNWADEYPLHGYLLYDNLLRYWALKIWASNFNDENLNIKATEIKKIIEKNFWPDNQDKSIYYHPKLSQYTKTSHWLTGFHPGHVYEMFDASANGLAMMLGFCNQDHKNKLIDFTEKLFVELGQNLIPAFWPIIKEGDLLWEDLSNNYAYHFKNHPHQFHNGGIWPVMMGIFCLGLLMEDQQKLKEKIYTQYQIYALDEKGPFAEYIDSRTFIPGGKKELCFSAAGCIFMAQNDSIKVMNQLFLR